MTECVACGGALTDEARFCPVCGTPAPAPAVSGPGGIVAPGGAPTGPPACPACGAALVADARFCGECGRPLDGVAGGSIRPVAMPVGPAYGAPAAGAYAARAPRPASDALSGITPFDWVIIGAALVALVGSFLARYSVTGEIYSQSFNAWDSTWSGLAVVLCVVAAILVGVKAADAKTPIPSAVVMGCGVLATLLMLIEFTRKPDGDYGTHYDFGAGIFICTAAAIAVAIAGFLRWQRERAPQAVAPGAPAPWAGGLPGPAPNAYAPPPSPPSPTAFAAAAPHIPATPSVPATAGPAWTADPLPVITPDPAPAAPWPAESARETSPPVAASPAEAFTPPVTPPSVTPVMPAVAPAVAAPLVHETPEPDDEVLQPTRPAEPASLEDTLELGAGTPSLSASEATAEDGATLALEKDAVAETQIVAPPVAEPFRPLFCGNCGERLSGRPFCKSCGQRVES